MNRDSFQPLIGPSIYAVGVLWILVYFAASFFPDSALWGINHLAWFSLPGRILIVLISFVLLVRPISSLYIGAGEHLAERMHRSGGFQFAMRVLFGMAAMILFNRLKIVTDIYGDTRTLLSWLSQHQYTLADLFDPKETEPLTRIIYQSASAAFHADLRSTYQIVGVLAGGIAVMTYFTAIRYVEGSNSWKLFVVLIGVTAGVNQLYFGHVEDYTLLHLWSLIFLMILWLSFEGKQVAVLLIMWLLIGLRLHVEAIFFIPSCVYAVMQSSGMRSAEAHKWTEPRIVGRIVGVTVLAGIIAYFFYFHADHYLIGDREEVAKKLFLPIENFHPSPHSYSLLSWKHISDWLQEILLTASPGAIGILILSGIFRKRIDWKDPKIIGYGLAAFYFLLFNFTITPTLTPVRDWDFLSLAADPLTFLAIALSLQIFPFFKESGEERTILAVGVALAVLSCSIFVVNADPEKVSRRLEGAGAWAYHGFYSGSSYIINVGEKMITDPDEQIARREDEIRKLEPYASRPDLELGVLYHKLGEAALMNRRLDLANENFTKAYDNDSSNASAIRSLGMVAMLQGRYADAEKLLDYYNENLNLPVIRDFGGLALAQDLAHLRSLETDHADSAVVRKQLDDLYAMYVREYYH